MTYLPIRLIILLFSILFVGNWGMVLRADGDPDRGGWGKESRKFWESLSEEDREKLRSALREVWTDPGVLSAREEVKRASESYQKAVREAIAKNDPEVAKLIVEAHAASDSDMRGRPDYGGSGRYGQRRSGDYPMGPPGFLEKMPKETKEQFLKAQKEAAESEQVAEARNRLEEVQKEDDAIREKRMKAHRELRRAIFDAMLESDPGLKDLLDKLETPFRFRDGEPKSGPSKSSDGQKPPTGPKPE